MVVGVLPSLHGLIPLAAAIVAANGFAGFVDVDRDLLSRAAIATAGSALVAYGLREVLRAWGGGYYCCNHAFYVALGLVISAIGWVFLLAAFRGPILAAE